MPIDLGFTLHNKLGRLNSRERCCAHVLTVNSNVVTPLGTGEKERGVLRPVSLYNALILVGSIIK